MLMDLSSKIVVAIAVVWAVSCGFYDRKKVHLKLFLKKMAYFRNHKILVLSS
jgi:hypothetical protein